ncbi:MAG: hypothetical protein A4E73_03506 [Syntrophaceae bacterium PtaU1.Bin231]|nr:MAG: hypothetical protein A4E73_03506 [Syntrophaceae bacterium PtaU1.Bin231]
MRHLLHVEFHDVEVGDRHGQPVVEMVQGAGRVADPVVRPGEGGLEGDARHAGRDEHLGPDVEVLPVRVPGFLDVVRDHLDRPEGNGIGQVLPVAGRQRPDGMGQGVQGRGRHEMPRQALRQFRVQHRELGDELVVADDQLLFLRPIHYNSPPGHFRTGAGGGGNADDRFCLRRDQVQADIILQLAAIRFENRGGLAGIHHRSAAEGDPEIGIRVRRDVCNLVHLLPVRLLQHPVEDGGHLDRASLQGIQQVVQEPRPFDALIRDDTGAAPALELPVQTKIVGQVADLAVSEDDPGRIPPLEIHVVQCNVSEDPAHADFPSFLVFAMPRGGRPIGTRAFIAPTVPDARKCGSHAFGRPPAGDGSS